MDTFDFSDFGLFTLPLIVFVFAMWRLRRLRFLRRFLASILFSGALFLGLLILGFSIILRDGIGPDSNETHGMESFDNCWTGIVYAIVIGAILVTFGIILARPSKKDSILKNSN
jgi:drug/metabolite transporter (DMT)-like permease